MLQLAAHHSWDKQQKPAKNETHKIREIDWFILCLHQFDRAHREPEQPRM